MIEPAVETGGRVDRLKAQFPAFGGKSRIVPVVWERLGSDVRNAIDPFVFSSSFLLGRPGGAGPIETINDRNHYVANYWRAVQKDPEAVAHHADWPVNEVDMHARHQWLVHSDEAAAQLSKVREDPEWCDVKIAGWWCWGACAWIGSGWCDESAGWITRPHLGSDGMGQGVHRQLADQKMPMIGDRSALGRGVLAGGVARLPEQIPEISGDAGASGRGVHSLAGPKRVKLTGNGVGCGVHSAGKRVRLAAFDEPGTGVNEGRVQLADEFSRGRGVHGGMDVMTCEQRRRWLIDWTLRLADRMRTVRVCCGHWSRVCNSDSTMTRLGTTAVFLDPPYAHDIARVRAWLKHLRGDGPEPDAGGATNRTKHIYANDRTQDVDRLCAEVCLWCLEWGPKKGVRIALCGLEGEYPEIEAAGWDVLAWKSNGGYGNRSGTNANAARERVWFSPGCLPRGGDVGLFGGGV